MTTSFPQSIGMSASWDPELIKQAGEVTGTEARHLAPSSGLWPQPLGTDR